MKYQPVFLTVAILSVADAMYSQQLPLFTQYREMQGILNPAALNSDYLLYDLPTTVAVSARTQWAKTADGPKTQVLHGEHLFERDNSALLPGISLLNDQAGMVGFTGLYGRLAAIVSRDPYDGGIAVGLQGGLVQYRVDLSEARLHDPNDITATTNHVQWFPDVGAGVYYYKRWQRGRGRGDLFWAGLSVPQALGLNLRFRDDNGSFETQRLRHFYSHAGYVHALYNEGAFLEFSSWVKYVRGAPVNVDLNFRYQINNTFWLGAGGSTARALHTEFGVRLDGFPGADHALRIGYGFDYWFARFGPEMGGTHELTLAVGFGEGR